MSRYDATSAVQTQVTRDAAFLIALARTTVGRADASWLSMIYLDWYALCIHEVRQVARKGVALPGAQDAMHFATEVDQVRHSGKLLNNTASSAADQLSEMRARASAHWDQLIGRTRIPRLLRASRLIGRLQRDVGVVLWKEHIVATTLSIAYHLDLEPNSDPEVLSALAKEVGSLVASFGGQGAFVAATQLEREGLDFPPLQAKDAYYESFFDAVFPGIGQPESMLLSTISCRLRSAEMMMEVASDAGRTARMYSFKFRFAAVWQVAATLRTIADEPTTLLTTPMIDDLRHTLALPVVAGLADQGPRRLRNILVHYQVDPKHLPDPTWDEPLLGLAEVTCGGRSWEEIDGVTTAAADSITAMLDRWCGPYDRLLVDP